MRSFCVAFLLLSTSPAFIRAADIDADAKKVVEKAIEAHGGKEALARYKAGENAIKGTMNLMRNEVAFTGEIVHALPKRIKVTMDVVIGPKKIKLVQLADGDKTVMSMDGKEVPMSDDQKNEVRQASLVQEVSTLLPLLEGRRYTVKSGQDEKVGEAAVATLLVSAEGFIETKLSFDKATGLLVKTSRKALTETGEKAIEESVMTDFKKTEGVLLPTTMTVTRDGRKFMSLSVTSTKVLEKIDPKVFTAE